MALRITPYLPAAFSDYLDNGGAELDLGGEGGLMISRRLR